MVMNTTIKSILGRSSTRSFNPLEISEKVLNNILKCAQWAPSGLNQQPWHFIIIRKKETIGDFVSVVDNCFDDFRASFTQEASVLKKLDNYRKYLSVASASVLICVLGRPYKSYLADVIKASSSCLKRSQKNVDPGQLSIGAAIQNILVSAESFGLGSCWMTGPLIFQKDLERFLRVKHPWNLVSLIPIGGKRQSSKQKRNRLPLEEVCEFWD